LWKGWVLPASPSDLWLSAGSAAYYSALAGEEFEKSLDRFRATYFAAAAEHDQSLSSLQEDLHSNTWFLMARSKGALALDAVRRKVGDGRFLAAMRDFFDANTTKPVTTAQFNAAIGAEGSAVLGPWLAGTGLPGGPARFGYAASLITRQLPTAVIVYGTTAEGGANRYAAEQLQSKMLDWFEGSAPIRKDFEVTDEELRTRDVIFVGRPETNSALAAWSKPIGLRYEQAAFQVSGQEHASEYEALLYAAPNPKDAKHMVLVMAGNSPLETVRLVAAWNRQDGQDQYAVYDHGKLGVSGFEK
jgi:hypothetical protein